MEPEAGLLPRRTAPDEVPAATTTEVRRAVLAGRRLCLHDAATGQEPRWRTVELAGTLRQSTVDTLAHPLSDSPDTPCQKNMTERIH